MEGRSLISWHPEPAEVQSGEPQWHIAALQWEFELQNRTAVSHYFAESGVIILCCSFANLLHKQMIAIIVTRFAILCLAVSPGFWNGTRVLANLPCEQRTSHVAILRRLGLNVSLRLHERRRRTRNYSQRCINPGPDFVPVAMPSA